MSDHYELVGSIRRSLVAIRDYYDMALIPPQLTSGVKLPTQAAPGEKMKYAGRPMRHSPPPTDLAVVQARLDTHSDLSHYCRVILNEVTTIDGGTIQTRLDPSDPLALARFIETWAERLAAECPAEAQQADQDFAGHARRLRLMALPDRRDWMPIGDCPVTVADADGNQVACGTALRAYPDEDDVHRFVTCPGCGTEDTLQWWMSQIVPEASELAPVSAVIASVAARTHRLLNGNLIRQWAHQGHIQRHGRDVKGRTLYSVAAVLAYSERGEKEDAA